MRKRAGFWVYNDMFNQIMGRRFTYEQAGRLIMAMFHYSFSREYGYKYDGNEMKLSSGGMDPKVLEVFKYFLNDFEEDHKKVEEKSERMQRNGRKGGIAKARKMREIEEQTEQ